MLLFLNSFVTLFSLLDPFGAAVILMALTDGETEGRIVAQAKKASVVSTALLFFFMLLGGVVFSLFGVSIEALKIAGGLILIQVAFKMLEGKSLTYRSTAEEQSESEKKEDVGIIPMAIPILAGPAAIAAVMVFAEKADRPIDWVALFLAVSLAMFLTYQILRRCGAVTKWLGETGVRILVRAMGLILIAMGVEFILSGAKNYFMV